MGWWYLVRRVAQMVPALGTVLLVTFGLIRLAPGDPAGAYAGEYATPETIALLRREYGLDEPIWRQFTTYVGNVLQGDFGTSFSYARPVSTIMAERLPATILLAVTALVLSVFAGTLLGKLAARRPSGVLDTGITGTALLGHAIPGFFLAQVAILLLGLRWPIFPVLGMTDTRIRYTGIDQVLDVTYHLILPAVVLAASEITLVIRLTRTGVIEQMDQDYTRTATAKGLSKREVLARHAFPNAALPLITVIGSRVGFILSGAVIIETVFSWPGVGLLLVNSVQTGDRPLTLGLVLIVAISVLVANLLTDLVYAWVDPRIRYS
jgi:peptide/nickel transport system permease protein